MSRFGDLNYRIDLERSEVLQLIEQECYDTLYKEDQLRKEMQNKTVFVGFQEHPPPFKPTYQYRRGCREYSDEKQRVPSWCDRILWRSHPRSQSQLKMKHFSCCDEIMTSDHSPISGIFYVDTILSCKLEDLCDRGICSILFSELIAEIDRKVIGQ